MFVATGAIVAGIIFARFLYAHGEGEGYTQKDPHFTAHTGASSMNELVPVPREVWNELRPTSGEYIRHRAVLLARRQLRQAIASIFSGNLPFGIDLPWCIARTFACQDRLAERSGASVRRR